MEEKFEEDESRLYEQYFIDDIKKEEFYDIKMNSNDNSISSFASVKFSNLKKEFQMLRESPKKIRVIDQDNFRTAQDLSESKPERKKKSEKYSIDSFYEKENINGNENANGYNSKDENNLSGVNFIDKILKNIQNDSILKSNEEAFSHNFKLYENCDLKNNDDLSMHNYEMKNTLYIWSDNKKFSYSWHSSMETENFKNSIYNFCMNIINEEFFYLIRLEKLKENNLYQEEDTNIEKFYMNDSTTIFYKKCESYNWENLGNIKKDEEYLIKKKEKMYEKLEDPLNFPEVLRAIEYTKEGSNLLKHTVFNIPHLRFFFLSKNLSFMKWFSSRKTDEESKIYFSDINSLEINNIDDKLFENYKIHLLKKLSFCITYNNENKKIILTCKSLQEFNYWVTAIRALMFHFRKIKVTKCILLSHLSEFASLDENKRCATTTSWNLTDQSNKFCELKSIKEKEREKIEEFKSLKKFHLYNLISFPDYNIYQIKTKFYLLKEKLYKYRILIEREIDDFHASEKTKDSYKNNTNQDSKNIICESIKKDMVHYRNYEHNLEKKRMNNYDLDHHPGSHHYNSYKGSSSISNSSSDNNSEISNLYKNNRNEDSNTFSEVTNLKEDKKNIKENRNTKLKTHVISNNCINSNNMNERKERENFFKKNNFNNSTEIKNNDSSNKSLLLNINKTNIIQQLEENNMKEDSNEFKLFLIIKIFNRIDKKLRIIQNNIIEIAKILNIEESKQKKNDVNFFSIDNILKYTADIYKTIENKIVKNENNINIENVKFDNSHKNNNEIDKYEFTNSFTNIDNISNPSNENLLHLDNNGKQVFSQEQDPSEKKIIDSRKFIHNILFDMWLCEIELGNIEDIYTIYTYNLRRNNFLINFDGSKILKTISQRISTTVMKYINF